MVHTSPLSDSTDCLSSVFAALGLGGGASEEGKYRLRASSVAAGLEKIGVPVLHGRSDWGEGPSRRGRLQDCTARRDRARSTGEGLAQQVLSVRWEDGGDQMSRKRLTALSLRLT